MVKKLYRPQGAGRLSQNNAASGVARLREQGGRTAAEEEAKKRNTKTKTTVIRAQGAPRFGVGVGLGWVSCATLQAEKAWAGHYPLEGGVGGWVSRGRLGSGRVIASASCVFNGADQNPNIASRIRFF